jgi:hypothetical protein
MRNMMMAEKKELMITPARRSVLVWRPLPLPTFPTWKTSMTVMIAPQKEANGMAKEVALRPARIAEMAPKAEPLETPKI